MLPGASKLCFRLSESQDPWFEVIMVLLTFSTWQPFSLMLFIGIYSHHNNYTLRIYKSLLKGKHLENT